MLDDILSDRPGNMREFMIGWMKTKGIQRKPQVQNNESVKEEAKSQVEKEEVLLETKNESLIQGKGSQDQSEVKESLKEVHEKSSVKEQSLVSQNKE